MNNEEDRKAMRQHLDQYRNKSYKETPLLDRFDDIVAIVSNSYEGDKFKAKLLLVYDVLMRKE